MLETVHEDLKVYFYDIEHEANLSPLVTDAGINYPTLPILPNESQSPPMTRKPIDIECILTSISIRPLRVQLAISCLVRTLCLYCKSNFMVLLTSFIEKAGG
jgi:hypothetical protein